MIIIIYFLIYLINISNSVHEQDTDPLPVRAQVAPGVGYVGQGIEVRVGVVAEGDRPEIVPPKVAGADLTLVGSSLRPISASGIGDLVMERNQFLSRYRLVPHRSGPLDVPPFRARLRGRVGVSEPLRLMIETPPLAGRPAAFLGGVGPFEVAAEARPATLRAGRTFEFRVRVTGPGALGATRPPSLARFDRLPLGLEVEPLATESVAEPPARDFRYRIRPTRAGEAILPPIAVAAFEPRWNQYVTKITAGVPIRVVAVPRFEPDSLAYGPAPDQAPPTRFGLGSVVALVLAGMSLACLAWLWFRRRPTRSRNAPRLARRLASSIDASTNRDETARRTVDGLIAYLALTTGRPRGALTPGEARRGFLQAAGSADLSARAEQLVARCDRIRFGSEGVDDPAPAEEARRFFNDLALRKLSKRGGDRAGGQPGEAVETAT
jgi:hypothetical protein